MKLLVLTSAEHPQIMYEVDALRKICDLELLSEDSIGAVSVLKHSFWPFLRRLPLVLLSLARLRIPPLSLDYFLYVQEAGRVIDYVITRRVKYDVIYAHWLFPAAFIGMVTSRALGGRVVSSIWGYDIQVVKGQEKYGIANAGLATFSRQIMRKSDVIVVNNVFHEASARRLIGGDSSHKVVLVPSTIPDIRKDLAEPADACRKRLGIPYDAKVVLYSPSLRAHYGIAELVEAAAIVSNQVPNVFYIVLGEGEAKERAMARVKQLGLETRFFFLGNVRHSIVFILYACSDLVCDLSYAGQGTTTAEAFCFGKPVIGVSASKRTIEHGRNGFLVGRRDYPALATYITKLLKDRAMRDRFAENARRSFELKLSMDSRIQSLSSIFMHQAEWKHHSA